ncbi:hypothetical protein FHR81_005357 [Actinoalloteichus hoggarensis]|nr:uridine kinase [Actinoalloteichus hoggarensis]MBB5924280.1 hypothetical protein [Actinoalloteichus hoggarensis]
MPGRERPDRAESCGPQAEQSCGGDAPWPAGTPARLVDTVLGRPPRLGSVRVAAVDGPSGSGKSTLADAMVAESRARGVVTGLVRSDHFATWTEPASWWHRLEHEVLVPLRAGRAGGYRPVEWTVSGPRLGGPVRVEVPEVLVLEGVTTGRRAAAGLLCLLVWVCWGDEGHRRERAVARDGESIRVPLLGWQRFERAWFAEDRPWERADVLLTDGGPPGLQATADHHCE